MPSCINFGLAMLEGSDMPQTEADMVKQVTLAGSVSGKGRWVRQMGCPGQFGIIEIRLEPYHGASQFQLIWQVTEEQIPEEYIPGVIKGVRQMALQERPEASVLTGIRVIVVAGVSHPVDSDQRSFTIATRKAFEDALAHAQLIPALERLAENE